MPSPMQGHDLFDLFVQPLERLRVRYLVTGSVAAMMYGEPRVTHDIDLVVFLREQDLHRLPEAFPEPVFYVPPVEVIASEVARPRAGQFNIIHVESALKADFHTANRDELQAWAFRNARKYSVEGQPVRLAPPEYVILSKLEYFKEGGSEKHLRDIRSMLTVSRELVNIPAIEEWVQRRGVSAEWERVRS